MFKALFLPGLVFLGFGACVTMAQQAPEAATTCDDPTVECVDIYTSVFSPDAVKKRALDRVGPLDFFVAPEDVPSPCKEEDAACD
jgi:hypothetical protein